MIAYDCTYSHLRILRADKYFSIYGRNTFQWLEAALLMIADDSVFTFSKFQYTMEEITWQPPEEIFCFYFSINKYFSNLKRKYCGTAALNGFAFFSDV